eukprot:CAMPEP_0174376032 /NCGR_PEP_ID=MMETSP0811_2-20130205/116729_1 /TAXON_ID=73025 ORGANISM="Eutreptiella gymnastica-like, Strain CCMP1594" /NCGR_SAMPLE_ID=MMETSP0811_2 /ASSEMBLY_ACC=CAM_ASM_000667 /LENGTH=34 /DNA_ID= /DNA_START= /DNA_END= /DNA_ORIENTATION=
MDAKMVRPREEIWVDTERSIVLVTTTESTDIYIQ